MPAIKTVNYDLANSVNSFGEDLLRNYLNDDDSTVLVSPFSIFMAFAMLNEGIDDYESDELREVFYLGGISEEELRNTCESLLDSVKDLPELEMANSMWGREDIDFKYTFVESLRNFFDAEVFPLTDVETLNNWCEEKTNGKIKDILDSIDPMDLLVLLNAMYFKSEWQKKFKSKNTSEGVFYSSDGLVYLPMMEQTSKFEYYEDENLQAIKMKYGEDDIFDMEILLPRPGYGYRDIFRTEVRYSERDGTIVLPKFKIEFSDILNRSLQDLGLHDVFYSGRFHKITEDVELYVSKVVHKTFLEVDEEGSEASAATAVVMRGYCMPPEPEFLMRCENPFVFKINYNLKPILDVDSNINMFLGYFNGE